MPSYIDAKGVIWGGRKIIDVDPDYDGPKPEAHHYEGTVLPKPGKPLPVARQSNKPPISDLSTEALKQILKDLELAKSSFANQQVSYVIVDNYGTVNRSNIKTSSLRVEKELAKRERYATGAYRRVGNTVTYTLDTPVEIAKGDEMVFNINYEQKFGTKLHEQMEAMHKEDSMDMKLNPEFYRRQAALHLATAEKLEGMPLADLFDEGQVITFQKKYGMSEYSFAAIKVDNGWAVTGNRQADTLFNWTSLLDFIGIESFDTISVMETRPELGIKAWATNRQKAKEIQSNQAVADEAKAQEYRRGTAVE